MLLFRLLNLLLHPEAYLDHNASTPVHPEVQRLMQQRLAKVSGNASSLHTPGRIARGSIEESRRTVAELLNCPPECLIFTSGGTEANNAAVKGTFPTGQGHLITTLIEHESVLGAAKQLEELGVRVTYLPAGRNGRIDPKHVAAAIRPETRLISVMHANNETGIIQPIPEVAAIAKGAGIPLHVDAVQSFGKIPVNVDDLGCDFLTVSSHKIRGPKGAGALFRRGTSDWRPLIFGGEQEFARRAGTEGTHQIAGFAAAARLAAHGREKVYQRLSRFRRFLKRGLSFLFPGIQINENHDGEQLPGTLNLTFPGVSGLRLLAGLDCYGISVSIGSACTANRIEPSHVLLGMGMSEDSALSTIRVSMGATTDEVDILFFLWALRLVLAGDPEGFSYLDPEHLTAERILSPHSHLIDLRLPHERFLSPSIPNAHQYSHIGFERHFSDIPLEKDVILMCSTGIFSLGAGFHLAKNGHKRVFVLFGGYSAWMGRYPDLLPRLLVDSRSVNAPAT